MLHLLPNIFPLVAVLMYNYNQDAYKNMFINYKYISNPYMIISGIIVIFSLAALSFKQVSRKSFGYAIYFAALCPCLLYIYLFLIHWSMKAMQLTYKPLIMFYCIMFGGAFGLFLGAIGTSGRKYNTGMGMGGGILVAMAWVLLHTRVLIPKFGFWLYEYFTFGAMAAIWCFYLTKDAELMLTKQADFYSKKDALLGAAHFFTDFAARFWIKLIVRPKQSVNIGSLDVTEMTTDAPLNL